MTPARRLVAHSLAGCSERTAVAAVSEAACHETLKQPATRSRRDSSSGALGGARRRADAHGPHGADVEDLERSKNNAVTGYRIKGEKAKTR